MTKGALVFISFGTAHLDALGAIEHLEKNISASMENVDIFRAFTSRIVIRKLAEEQNLVIKTPAEVMDELVQNGYESVLCQTLHVIPGIEYEKMAAELLTYRESFSTFQISRPLLSAQADYEESAQAICSMIPFRTDEEAIVLMGHGTPHFANAAYCQLENTFRFLGEEHVYVGTVDGFPGIEYILSRLKTRGIKTVYLMPFMIVAGDHAKNDLAGESPDSWKSILEASGFHTLPILTGLGELEQIGEIFIRHLKEAEQV